MASLSSLPKGLLCSALFLVILVSQLGSMDAKLTHHGGPLLTGKIQISLLFYGRIGRVQKNAVRGFLASLNNKKGVFRQQPSVANWWSVVESYQSAAARRGQRKRPRRIPVKVVNVASDPNYSIGKIMTLDFIKILVQKATAGKPNTLAVVVTDRQVTVQELCTGKCAQHGAFGPQPYVLVGNPETECPGACAWPFHRSDYGPQGVVLQPPSGNVGADAMVMSLAAGLADAVTNPFNSGFFQMGVEHAGRLGAGTVCRGMFGSGAFPGYPGKVRVDPKSGGAFNAHGVRGKKFLLPALWNPKTSSCWTPI
ncbi:hypothetical protein UlMin_024833 [Ulmus minor]